MCGGFLGNIINPIVQNSKGLLGLNGWTGLRDSAETAADLAGNYELPGSSLITDRLVSTGAQNQLNSLPGQLAQLGSGLAGGGAFGAGLQSTGGALEANALSNFANSTGLSSLFGGTPQEAGTLSNIDQGIANAPASADIANAASTPNISLGNTLTTGANGIGSVGGGTLGTGGTEATAGESLFAPSASGIGATGGLAQDTGGIGGTSSLGATADNGVPFNPALFNSGGNVGAPSADAFSGIGATQGGSTLSNLYNSVTGTPNVPAGSFNYDLSGNPVGASALSTASPDYAATAGGNMGLLNGLVSNGAPSASGATGGAGVNVLNGLMRSGLGYLLNQPNTQGKNAINTAVQQGQAAYAPYMAAGTQAENQLANLYGNNGSAAQQAAQAQFANTPGYQFALNQGINAVNANAAAMGSPLSGNNQQAVNNYAQGTANQTYNNYVNQLQNLASGGANAATGSANLGLTGAGSISQIGQNNANNANTAIGSGLNALFPSGINLQQLIAGLGNNGSGGLLNLI